MPLASRTIPPPSAHSAGSAASAAHGRSAAAPLGVATVVMVAFAAGAVWAVAGLWSGAELAGLAAPAGLLLGATARAQGFRTRWTAALLAAAATVLTGGYAAALIAVGEVAARMGLPMRQALPQVGAEMALALAWARASGWDVALLTVGAGLAAAVALRRASPQAARRQ